MIPKLWLINAALLAAVVFLGAKSYEVWTTGYDLPVAESPAEKSKSRYGGRLADNSLQPRGVYEVLASENLFSPQKKLH